MLFLLEPRALLIVRIQRLSFAVNFLWAAKVQSHASPNEYTLYHTQKANRTLAQAPEQTTIWVRGSYDDSSWCNMVSRNWRSKVHSNVIFSHAWWTSTEWLSLSQRCRECVGLYCATFMPPYVLVQSRDMKTKLMQRASNSLNVTAEDSFTTLVHCKCHWTNLKNISPFTRISNLKSVSICTLNQVAMNFVKVKMSKQCLPGNDFFSLAPCCRSAIIRK